MNCDIAFDLLTRGPVPAGDADSDAALDRHLAACHDCRRLAEAMRPAVDLWHEVLDDEEATSLPCYRGGLPVDDGTVAVRERTRSVVRSETSTTMSPNRSSWPMIAIGLAGLMIGAGLMSLGNGRGDTARDVSPIAAVKLVPDTGEQRLVALGTSADCRPKLELAGTSRSVWQCCSLCHQPDSAHVVQPAVLAKSCAVCHAETPHSEEQANRDAGLLDWTALACATELL